MPKQKLMVDKRELQEAIDKLEAGGIFDNRTLLWVALEQTDFAKNTQPRALKAQTAMLLAKKLGVDIKTPMGKRGSGEHLALAREKRSANPERKKAKRFSLKKAIRDKCMDCSCQQREEVRHCTVVLCPLYPVRPFQSHVPTGLEKEEGKES